MSDNIYLIYYNNDLVGIIRDSESFWYLYDWLNDSNGVCNVVTVSKDDVVFVDGMDKFNKLCARHGEVSISRSKINIEVCYDDNLS